MPKRAAIDRVAEPPSSVKRTLRLTILNQLNCVNQPDATDLADIRMRTERLRHSCGQPCRRLLRALQDILLIKNIEHGERRAAAERIACIRMALHNPLPSLQSA